MTHIDDPEFGEIPVRRTQRASSIRIKIGTDGRYVVSAPLLTPLFMIRQVINHSREELRNLRQDTRQDISYRDGDTIGRTHRLAIIPTQMVSVPKVRVERQKLLVYLPPRTTLSDRQVQQQIKDSVATILRKEAKAYLPDRLAYFARTHGFSYERVRFSHSGGRWGSCSSTGTISLNIALMKLPDALIDYVLIHELAHTRHMNHSAAFWGEVRRYDPLYRQHRERLKKETPSV